MILIYCPCKNKKEAKRIAESLIAKKLVACANIVGSDSLYVWKGKLCCEKEAILLLKTAGSNKEKVNKEIKKLHSYDLPAIININCRSNKLFEDWVIKQTWQNR